VCTSREPTQSVVHATVLGEDAKNVSVNADSAALVITGNPLDIKSGSSVDFGISVSAKDVQDGLYNTSLWLTYSDSSGLERSKPIEESFYVLPYLELKDLRSAPDFWHPFGKETIAKTDSTNVLFKVSSESKNVIYQCVYAAASFNVPAPGLALNPSRVPVSALGPQGTSNDYSISVSSDNTPPGQYVILLSLYSKDNQLITQASITITVSA
jgi:hypothetical protein